MGQVTCQGCGADRDDVAPVRLGDGSVYICTDCVKEWELDK